MLDVYVTYSRCRNVNKKIIFHCIFYFSENVSEQEPAGMSLDNTLEISNCKIDDEFAKKDHNTGDGTIDMEMPSTSTTSSIATPNNQDSFCIKESPFDSLPSTSTTVAEHDTTPEANGQAGGKKRLSNRNYRNYSGIQAEDVSLLPFIL